MSDNAKSMPLSGHLEELRSRLLIVILVTGVFFLVCMCFYQQIWDWAMFPRERAAAWQGKSASDLFPLQFLRPLEGLSNAVGIALKTAFCLTLPVITTQIWLFVAPALTPKEKRALQWVAGGGSVLFFTGAALAFFYAVPTGLGYLAEFDRTLSGTVTQWRVDGYLDFVFMSCLGFGLGFELPLIMAALAGVGLISPEGILRHWRPAVFVMTVAGALFTPPDPYTMLFLSGCLIILFFTGYGLARLSARRNRQEEDETAERAETPTLLEK